MSATAPQAVNEAKLHEFMMKAVGEMGAAMNTALIVIGDKLGLYKAMAGAGPMTSAELATKTNTTERYVREWLSAQAAGGFITYDAATGRFTLPPEQAMALGRRKQPRFPARIFSDRGSLRLRTIPKITSHSAPAKELAGTNTTLSVCRDRTILPAELSRPLDQRMDSGAGRHRSKTESGSTRRRRRLRFRNVHDSDGAGLSEIHVCWF